MPQLRPTLLLADDHPMVLEGLQSLFASSFEVIGTATDGRMLLSMAESRRPDLVVADISMPGIDGIEATRRLQTLAPDVRVLILSIHDDPGYVQKAFEAGACGYLTKTATAEEMERALHEVLAGRFYVSPEVTRAVLFPALPCQKSAPTAAGKTLTARELDVLRLLAEGLSNEQIARRLGLAVTTVRTHLGKLYEKLHLKSRVELALYAAQKSGKTLDPGFPP